MGPSLGLGDRIYNIYYSFIRFYYMLSTMLIIRVIKAGWISIKISIKGKTIALNYSLLI
jgi:hypothetical protein